MCFPPIETVEEQFIVMLRRTRNHLMRQRTILFNALRGNLDLLRARLLVTASIHLLAPSPSYSLQGRDSLADVA